MKIIYIQSEFIFKVGSDTYIIKFENSKPPYNANIFKNGDYEITLACHYAANKSNARDILEAHLIRTTTRKLN